MRLVDDLFNEHTLIDAALGSLRTWSLSADRNASAGVGFVKFFRLFAGDFHHAREEGVLFPALVTQASLPADRGPIAILTREHRELGAILDELAPLLLAPPIDEAGSKRLRDLVTTYTHALWHHIDAENSVVLPEAQERLRRAFVYELESRPPTAEEIEAREIGERLVATFAPSEDLTCFRGDGCVMCPSYGRTCEGLEREWWSETEWDEAADRMSDG
jgi:hemerythrin-like domain-containing protein